MWTLMLSLFRPSLTNLSWSLLEFGKFAQKQLQPTWSPTLAKLHLVHVLKDFSLAMLKVKRTVAVSWKLVHIIPIIPIFLVIQSFLCWDIEMPSSAHVRIPPEAQRKRWWLQPTELADNFDSDHCQFFSGWKWKLALYRARNQIW